MKIFLNYHHLRYFRTIANEGNLPRASAQLGITPSALSIQLRQLEESLGHSLFDRIQNKFVLTEAGRIALDYAESIFKTGEEMIDTLHHRPTGKRHILRIGAVSTLSRNFQLELIKPFLNKPEIDLVLRSGALRDLLPQLETHTLDIILSNFPVRRDSENPWSCHLLQEQPVSLVGRPRKSRKRFVYPRDLEHTPVLLPGLESQMRTVFDRQMEEAGIRPLIAAEVDDMAMLRLLAQNSDGVSLVPLVVVQDELRQGSLVEYCRIPRLVESFYAITPHRRFPNPFVADLVKGQRKKIPQPKPGPH